jgi:uncharacterized membrane protein
MTDTKIYAGAVAVGAMAGVRSLSGPALVSSVLPSDSLPVGPVTLRVLVAGEAIADKLPFMPDRTKFVPLVGRAVMGGLSGAAVCASRKRSVALGAALGALSAVGMAFAAFKIRKALSENFPGPLVGLAEDATLAAAGWVIASNLKQPRLMA